MKRIIIFFIFCLSYFFAAAQNTIIEALRQQSNLSVFTKIVDACGLSDELSKVRDEVYEEKYSKGEFQDLPELMGAYNGRFPEHRYYGYTLFPETDDFWKQTLNKAVADISVSDIEQWASTQGQTLHDFVRYHILPVKLSPDNLVIHYNEKGYNYLDKNMPFTIPVYEVYEVLGGGQLLKLYQCGPNHSLDGTSDIFINRTPVLDDGMHGDLHEISITPQTKGIRLNTTLVTRAQNGYIYPINDALIYNKDVREQVLGGRLRYDIAALFPELMNNGIRANKSRDMSCGLPSNDQYCYCEGLDIKPGTQFYFLSGLGNNWMNWQGDEFEATGVFDFTIKLPPVPTDGEYELRLGLQSNSNRRSIALFSFGTDKENLKATGLPVDMRQSGTYIATNYGNYPSSVVGWEQDSGDEEYDRSIDLRMYEAGFLKGPANFSSSPGANPVRNQEGSLRRIIWRGEIKAGEDHYLRIRSTLSNNMLWCYLDYLEWCPKSVYANPDKPEDIW